MKINKKTQSIKILKFYLILFYLFILTILLFTGYSYSKYKILKYGNITGNVAKPIFIIEKEDTKIIEVGDASNNMEYNFSIKNYSNVSSTEVPISYRIIIDSDDGVLYKIFDSHGEEVVINDGKSPNFILDTTNPIKQSYKLVILNANSLNQLDDVKIYIEGKQIING